MAKFSDPVPMYFPLAGGLDEVTPHIDVEPGRLIACDGVEVIGSRSGYHRKGGYERCAGDVLPSEATVVYIEITAPSGTYTAEDAFTCSATGVTVWPLESNASPTVGDVLPCAIMSGDEVSDGDVFSDGSNIFSVGDVRTGTTSYTTAQRQQHIRDAIELVRESIPVLTGSGNVLGGFRLNGELFAFRNNAAGTEAKLYKGTGTAWSEISMPDVMYFENGITEIEVGDEITDGSATATVASVTRQTGAWNYTEDDADKSAGYLTLTGVTGTFTAGNRLTNNADSNNIVSNGSFGSDTVWNKGTGWTISAGTANKAAGTASDLDQNCSAESGETYILVYTVSGRTGGAVQPKIGTVTGTSVNANGTYRDEITGDGASLYFSADSSFDGSIDDVTLIKKDLVGYGGDLDTVTNGNFAADRAWDKGTGWTISGGTASHASGSMGLLTHPYLLYRGRSIKITFTVSGMSAGTLTPMLGSDEGTAIDANGTYTQYISCTEDVTSVGFSASSAFDGSIDDVTVVDGGYADVESANQTYTLNPGGRYECKKHNFTNIADNDHMYGVSGVNEAFEFDGENYIPIYHPDTSGYPSHILIHQERLLLAFPGGEWPYSVAGQPRIFNAILGAGARSAGADIISTHTVNGNAAVAFCKDNYWMLTGDGVYDEDSATRNWSFHKYDENIGADEWSVAGEGDFFFLNHAEIRSLKTTEAYGGFYTKAIAEEIRPFLEERVGTVVATLYCKEKSQYRLFYEDGKALYVTFFAGKVKGQTIVTFPDIPVVTWANYEEGVEYMYFGGSDGYVYRMDSGDTCDDDYIEGSFRIPFHHYKTPRNLKDIDQLTIELVAPSMLTEDTEISYIANWSYGNTVYPRANPVDVTELDTVGGIYGNNAGYGAFRFSGAVVSEIVINPEGYGSNFSLLISFRTKYDTAFGFLAILADVITHGLERR